MLPSLRILTLSALSILAILPASFAQATEQSRPAAPHDAKDKALAAAIADCDRGAAIPLDPDIRAAPVQYGEMFPANFDLTKLKALQAQCLTAMLGAPKQKRLNLQWLRVTVLLGDPGVEWLTPQIQAYADAGSAEANFLLYRLYVENQLRADPRTLPISREAAIAALNLAAESGHLSAMQHLAKQYLNGPLLRRDVHKGIQIARRILSMPPQGKEPTVYESEIVQYTRLLIARITLNSDDFKPQDYRSAYAMIEADWRSGGSGSSVSALLVATALRFGRGVDKDAARARQIFKEQAGGQKFAVPPYADMLARGEGGPPDVKQALTLLREEDMQRVPQAGILLADILLEGKIVGRQPQEAIQALAKAYDIDASIGLASLLADYHPRIADGERLVEILTDAALAGEPGAAMALARLKLSGNSQFTDIDGGRALLARLSKAGDRQATWLFAASQYSNLGTNSARPSRREEGLSDADLLALLDEGFKKKEPEAFLLAAKLTRRGILYPQDDQAATNLLISAANLGSVEGMVLLGKAYDEGLGIPKNPRERLHAWRMAAQLGSLAARINLANAFTFDSFDKLVTLDEGVTGRLVLFFNGKGRMSGGFPAETMASVELAGLFSGRAAEAGSAALAEAVMNAFRQAPAGLQEPVLIGVGKALPDVIRIAVEMRLKQDGFYDGQAEGYFGPAVRKALVEWVDAKGPYEPAVLVTTTAKDQKQATKAAGDLDAKVLDRVRDSAFKLATDARTDRQKMTALNQLNVLARFGDLAPRWALLRIYHQAQIVRNVVSPDEITRYGLDIMVAKPAGMDKAEFEFIFVATQIFQDGQSGVFGAAAISAIRDDPRLQDPLTLGGIMGQFIFAPGACDAILKAGQKAGVTGLGTDGCDETSRTALIAFARNKGTSGASQKMRNAALAEILQLDASAAK